MKKRQITRFEAEDLIKKMEVLYSEIQCKQKEMQILFRLSNSKQFFVIYNLSSHNKSYYIVE